ncbi:MAG: FISUMP domain-containing protein [Bacteroidales bacterium]
MKKLPVTIILALFLLSSCEKGSLPEVETLPASIADATHVTLNVNVIDEGRTAVTTRGFCWALTANPTVNDNFSQNEFGPGKFTQDIEIVPDTTYYVRTYATNSSGTVYGNEISFSTTDSLPGSFSDSRDGTKYHWVKIGNQIWMAENLAYLPSVNISSSGSETSPFYYVFGYERASVNDAKATANYATYGVLYRY